ncbi:hypothetical protein GJV85_05570 [Sulfurimonas aquatica]|uniref:Flagellar hook-length control protein-like C-terminal domain-containing protein n=1 Tax=Sulfurimonas aquatica TaxID=2672570 RepID=A0A975AZY9_9BACT|nr:flagellar hook-length control protein FliK [Sulfurimonas aquatica]QSZ41595.1 hypothetical protein GJV85_05570 [Sulfurimonas aquatica]
MVGIDTKQTLNILLPNTNKALSEVIKDASPKELAKLSEGKELKSLLSSILKDSANDESQNKLLLSLVKNNPTLKEIGNGANNLKELLALLKQDKNPLPLEKLLQTMLSDIKNIDEKGLKSKIENSGVFLESKIKHLDKTLSGVQIKELLSHDLKAVLLKTQEELSSSTHPNKQELLKQIDKLTLQIDYHQLLSHLNDSSSLYLPYSWDALEEGSINIKTAKEDKFFCDIELKLKEYGEIKLRLGMFETNQLSMNINTQNSALKKLLQENLPQLKRQLLDVGINPSSIRFVEDEAPAYEDAHSSIALGFEVKA